jgi:phospholipase C
MADIRHVFVLMLENRSFDHMFGLSRIPGIHAATSANSNSYGGRPYPFGPGAPDPMRLDPHHGFENVMTQLFGAGTSNPSRPYPRRTNSGFVADFAVGHRRPPSLEELKTVMLAIATAREAPALHTLATQYALCDEWYSSVPGATWPNRFFVHGASSNGIAHGPTKEQKAAWTAGLGGFTYPRGSIFDRLGPGNYRLYQNREGHDLGRFPQVAALKGVKLSDVRRLSDLETELAGGRAAPYTFIEPAYGNIVSGSYRDGSSQHPLDELAAGDRLIARVYRMIRNSPVWEKSLLIVTYDEHGGFYDSGVPARTAPPPNDGKGPSDNPFGFDFSIYGARVPAVVVSPWIAKGVVDHTLYDHTSILATVERRFGLQPLTDRDRLAGDLLHLLGGRLRPDSECPRTLPELPAPAPAFAEDAPDTASLAEPIEDGDNLIGFLFVAEKAQREIAPETLAFAPPTEPKTRAEAELYLRQVVPQLEADLEARGRALD